MQLDSINIKRFHSIESTELTSCGKFNVLIGKNNSGKSNILSSVNAFFNCVSDEVVTLDPAVGQELDFFEKNLSLPIEFTVMFTLSSDERGALIRDIVTEAPQMKNAVDGLDPTLKLLIVVSVVPPPDSFAFVSRIALVGSSWVATKQTESDRVLFNVGENAAKELFDNLNQTRKQLDEAETFIDFLPEVRRFDKELFGARAEKEGRPPLRYILDIFSGRFGARLDSVFLRKLETLVKESSNYNEFESAVQNHITLLQEEATRIKDEHLKNKVVTFAGEQPAIPQYVRNLLSKVSRTKVLYQKERRKQIGRDEAVKLLSLKVTRGGPQVLSNIQETVSALLGVQIDAFESEPANRRDLSPRRSEPNAEMDIDNFLADVNGSGIREALRIVLDFEFEQPDILLIEEPEIYLHPSLETSMMRYLKRISSNCQVFISTHSTNFLDTGEMKNVYLISKTRSTQVQILNYEEAEFQIPRELGIRLSSLFMFDRLVFVEGPIDEAVFREWASILQVNLSHYNVGFVHMGGVRNFTHYATEATLSFLTRRQVQMWFIIDRDERDENEISKLQQIAGDNVKVTVLQRRELENYLISSRAIAEFIGLKKDLQGSKAMEYPTESDVSKVIDDCAEDLKQVAVDKQIVKAICSPIYPDFRSILDDKREESISDKVSEELQRVITRIEETKQSVPSLYAQQYERIGKLWASDKLNRVPGDLLLDSVCKKFGVRFRKENDSVRLAQIMRENEIPKEIQQIIREIGT